jgi:hypothetical protein
MSVVILKVIQSSAPSLSLKSLFHPQLDCIKIRKLSKIEYHLMKSGIISPCLKDLDLTRFDSLKKEYKEQQKGNLNKQVIA